MWIPNFTLAGFFFLWLRLVSLGNRVESRVVFLVFLTFLIFLLRCSLFSTRLFLFFYFFFLRCLLFSTRLFLFPLYFSRNCSLYFFSLIFFKTEGDWKRDRSAIPSVFLERDGNVDRRPALLVQTEAYSNRYVF